MKDSAAQGDSGGAARPSCRAQKRSAWIKKRGFKVEVNDSGSGRREPM